MRPAFMIAVLLCCAPAWAQEPDLPGRSPWALLAQALLSLLVVVGVIYLVYFGLRRLTDRRLQAGADGPIEVVQAQHLGGDRWIYLVQVEGRRLVVGGGNAKLTRLAELAPPGGEGRDEG